MSWIEEREAVFGSPERARPLFTVWVLEGIVQAGP